MPLQELPLGTILSVWREPNLTPLELVVVFAIVELVLKFAAHSKLVVWCNGYVPTVEEGMYVSSKQKAIVCSVESTVAYRLDMCGFQDRERLLSGHSTLTLVLCPSPAPEMILARGASGRARVSRTSALPAPGGSAAPPLALRAA